LLLIVGIIFVARAISRYSQRNSSTTQQTRTTGPTRTTRSQAPTRARSAAPKYTHKPRATRSTSSIIFRSQVPNAGPALSSVAQDLSGLRDAVTGMALDSSRGLYRCERCEVFYHAE